MHLLAKKVVTVYLSIVSASCNLGCRRHHLFPKSTYLQSSKRVIALLAWIQSAPRSGQPLSSHSICEKAQDRELGALAAQPDGPPPSHEEEGLAPNSTHKSREERGCERTPNLMHVRMFLLPGKRLPSVLGPTQTYSINFPLDDPLILVMCSISGKLWHLIKLGEQSTKSD